MMILLMAISLDFVFLFKIEIEGKIGIAPESDIAIDDVFIDDGKCPTNSLSQFIVFLHLVYVKSH